MTETVDIDQFRQDARGWIRANLEPRRPRAERTADGSRGAHDIAAARVLQRRLFDGGYAGISYPAEYGGRGLTAAHERVFREEAADYVTPDFGVAGGVTFGPIARSMLAHAAPEFLQRHIPRILCGEELWCQFYSEPEAGSDLAGVRTRATRDGDHWILNGSKIWSSGRPPRGLGDVPRPHRLGCSQAPRPDLVRRADRRRRRHRATDHPDQR